MYGIPVYRILQEVRYYEVETYFITLALAYKWGSSHFGGGVEEKTAIVELLLRIQGFIYVAKKV